MIKTITFNPFFPKLSEFYNKQLTVEQFITYNERIGETLVIQAGKITGIEVEITEPIKMHLNSEAPEETFNRRYYALVHSPNKN